MEIVAAGFGILIGLVAVIGALWGIGIAAVHVVFFFKALFDRLNSKEDDYYSKNIHR